MLVDLGIVRKRIHTFALPALEHAAALRVRPLETQTEDLVGACTVRRFDPQRPRGRGQRDRHHSRADQAAQTPADELQQARQLDLAGQRRTHFVERLELCGPVRGVLEEPGVLDRHGRLAGQRLGQLLILAGERPAGLLGQVEIAVGSSAEEDRNAEEAAHGRVVGGKADGAWVVGDRVQPQRASVGDQRPEDAASARQFADRFRLLGAEPREDEPLEALAVLVDHAEGRVACAGQLGCRLDELLEQGIEGQLRAESDARFDEAAEALVLGRRGDRRIIARRPGRRTVSGPDRGPWRQPGSGVARLASRTPFVPGTVCTGHIPAAGRGLTSRPSSHAPGRYGDDGLAIQRGDDVPAPAKDMVTIQQREENDLSLATYRRSLDDIRLDIKRQVAKAVVGYEDVVDLLFVAATANGHVLLEGPPGVAKTLLSGSVARAMGLDFSRIQFTPDTSPTHIVGRNVKRMGETVFEPGPLFTNMLLADEINRTPPRTQAALLEAMEERHVTIDGRTRWLPSPFLVVATQNPYESEGVYQLPDSQLDRFLFKARLDYGDEAHELEVLMRPHRGVAPDMLEDVEPVLDAAGIQAVQRRLDAVSVPDDVAHYVVAVVRATRRHPGVRLGASPRGAVHLFAAVKSRALLHNREAATIEDVHAVADSVLGHRLMLREGTSGSDIVRDALANAR